MERSVPLLANTPGTGWNFFDTDGLDLTWITLDASGTSARLFSSPLDGGAPAQWLTLQRAGAVALSGRDLYFGGQALWRISR